MTEPKSVSSEAFQRMTAKLVAAYVGNNTLAVTDLPDLISLILVPIAFMIAEATYLALEWRLNRKFDKE